MKPIFVGQISSGKGYHIYPAAGSLTTEHPGVERVVRVESVKGKWVERERLGRHDLPTAAQRLVDEQLQKRANEALRMGRRIIASNSSHAAARNRGTVCTIYARGNEYVVRALDWSRWEGDEDTTRIVGAYATLDDARHAAEAECQTRPSFGDVEYVT